MQRVRLGLTQKRRIQCKEYIFPGDYYDIPEIQGFQDWKAVTRYALKKLHPYAGQQVDVYLNGGMSIELLSVIQASAQLEISISVMHYHLTEDIYLPQKVFWKPMEVKKQEKREREYFVLCGKRHPEMKGELLFESVPNDKIFDFEWQEQQAWDVLKRSSGKEIAIYVTGLKHLCISVLNVAARLKLPVVFFHWDYDMEEYFPQMMDEIDDR